MINQQDDEFKTEPEAAFFLHVSQSCLRKWRGRGVGPKYCRFGRLIRYRASFLNEWIDSHSKMRGEISGNG